MLQHLIETPAQSSAGKGRVLPWPNDNCTHKTPRDHMDALGVTPNKIYKVVPMKSTARVRLQVRQMERGEESQVGLLMPSTIDRITEYLGNATAALDDVNGSAMAATQILALLGWAPPPGVEDIGLAQLDVSVVGARLDELSELRSQENASDADLALAVAAVVDGGGRRLRRHRADRRLVPGDARVSGRDRHPRSVLRSRRPTC